MSAASLSPQSRMESDSESLKCLLPVANKKFIAMGGNCKGVVMGGLAAALLGSSRKTDDIDVDVTSFPEFDPEFEVRHTTHERMHERVTYVDRKTGVNIDCDVATNFCWPIKCSPSLSEGTRSTIKEIQI